MNQCKSCGTLFQSTLTSCPVCHTALLPSPNKVTDDFTQRYNPLAGNVELVRLKSRLLTILLAVFLASSGIHLFYLGFIRRGLALLAINTLALLMAVIVPEVFGLFFFILFGMSHIISVLFYALNHDAKDARGDFLR